VVTASADGTARVWDAATGRPTTPPLRHRPYPTRAAFSPDGTKVVTAGEGSATVWDARTGQQVQVLIHRGGVWSAAFSPDGKTLLTTTVGGPARVWDLGTGKASIETLADVDEAAFSPDGRRIATVEGRAVRVRDAATGRPVGRAMDHDTSVTGVAFSPDGARVVTAADGYGRVWDAATGEPVTEPLAKFRVDRMHVGVFGPGGKRVLIAGEGATAAVWDVGTGRRVMTIEGGFDSVLAGAFSPDGTRVAVGCFVFGDEVNPESDTAVWRVAPDGD
jgi:WD40 repeat protein